MEVFGKGTDEPSRPLLPPGVCWICDMSPIQEEQRVIDTRRNSRPGQTAIHVTERKYVCDSCALDLGGAMGMVKAEEHADLRRQLDEETEALEVARAELAVARSSQVRVMSVADVLDSMRDVVSETVSETVRTELKQSAPKPAAKKSTPKPTEEASWET